MEEHERIQLRSEEVQEILGTPPRWIVRWGTTVAVFTVILMGVVSYIVKYPDIIQAAVVLTSVVPPESVNAKVDGNLEEFVENREEVRQGQLLAVIESTADLNDVIYLDTMLKELEYLLPEDLKLYLVERGLILGNIQAQYNDFMKAMDDYRFESDRGLAFSKQSIGNLDIQKRKTKNKIQQQRSKLSETRKIQEIDQKNVQAHQQLFTKGAISQKELMNVVEKLKLTNQQISDIESQITSYNVEIIQIDQQIEQIQQTTQRTTNLQETDIRTSIKSLRQALDNWKEQHLIFSPMDGIASYSRVGRERDYVKSGDEVMTIVPSAGQDSIIGKMVLPIQGSGKVEQGQDVVIKFASYPFHEFGSVDGKVEVIALIPTKGNYVVEISLPNGLITSSNKELDFHQEMEGAAEIITKDRRFIERIFDRLLAAFNQYD